MSHSGSDNCQSVAVVHNHLQLLILCWKLSRTAWACLCVCVYVCVCVCVYVCMYASVCLCACMHVYVCSLPLGEDVELSDPPAPCLLSHCHAPTLMIMD
jgi:hypothetical protein